MNIITRVFNKMLSTNSTISSVIEPNLTPAEGEISLLLSYYSKGYELNCMSSGKIADMHYMIFITANTHYPNTMDKNSILAPANSIIYVLHLPFNTQSHIVGISKKTLTDMQIDNFLLNNNMETVELEGDFGSYISLYASKGQQQQTRYVFNPDVMEYVVDYCGSNYWEIVGDEMYFVSISGTATEGVNIIDASQKFIEYIRPALTKYMPSELQAKHEAPYGQYWGEPYNCPICNIKMLNNDIYQSCPVGHGVFIGGRGIIRLRKGEITIVLPDLSENSMPSNMVNKLICPKCQIDMQKVNYLETNLVIDYCSHCYYRWLDHDEVSAMEKNPL